MYVLVGSDSDADIIQTNLIGTNLYEYAMLLQKPKCPH